MAEYRWQRWKAVLRNALTWGAAWAVAGGALVTIVGLLAPDPRFDALPERIGLAILAGIAWSIRFGVAGAVIGTVFAGLVRIGFRGRRLADIHPGRFALLGAVAGGVGVPLFLQTMNVLSGDGPIAWGLVVDDARWATVFGAAVAGGSILLARRAERMQERRAARVGGASEGESLPPVNELESSLAERATAARR